MSPTTLTGSTLRGVSWRLAGLALVGLAVFGAVWFSQAGAQSDTPAPTGFELTGTHGSITLSWDDPNDPTILRYQMRFRVVNNPNGTWINIRGSNATTTSYTLRASPGIRYTVSIRAIYPGGPSLSTPWSSATASDPATPTPTATATATATPVTTPTATPVATPTATATPPVTATPSPEPGDLPPAPELTVISTGASDYLLLEWTSDPTPTGTTWQYRQRTWENRKPLTWGAWTNIPNSSASTRSYRATGLTPDFPYDFEIRALSGTVEGEPSNVGEGRTYHPGSIPFIDLNQVVEGDGQTEWRFFHLNWVFTIPNGMRLRDATGWHGSNGTAGVSIRDAATGSWLAFDMYSQDEIERQVFPPGNGPQASSEIVNRDLNALFDQILDSVRRDQYR